MRAPSPDGHDSADLEGRAELPPLHLSPPDMGAEERALLLQAFDSNWIAPAGPHVTAFEEEVAETVGVRAAVALSSGTAALHLALLGLGIGPGDAVLVPSFTFAAPANAVAYVGATLVLVDVNPRTWTIDPDLVGEGLAALNGAKRRAVLAVDVYGQCADYESLHAACATHGAVLVEDSAEAFGSTYRGRQAGGFGAAAALSFNGNKIITSGGGGMLLTDDLRLAEHARYLSTQARDPVPHYEHRRIGYNYRLSNLLAAVGRGQLTHLQDRVRARRANDAHYRSALGGVPGLSFMPRAAYGESNCWLTCLLIEQDEFGATADDVRRHLEKSGIEARPTWKPLHRQPVFAGCHVLAGAISDDLFARGLALPSGSSLTQLDRERVVAAILATPRKSSTRAM